MVPTNLPIMCQKKKRMSQTYGHSGAVFHVLTATQIDEHGLSFDLRHGPARADRNLRPPRQRDHARSAFHAGRRIDLDDEAECVAVRGVAQPKPSQQSANGCDDDRQPLHAARVTAASAPRRSKACMLRDIEVLSISPVAAFTRASPAVSFGVPSRRKCILMQRLAGIQMKIVRLWNSRTNSFIGIFDPLCLSPRPLQPANAIEVVSARRPHCVQERTLFAPGRMTEKGPTADLER
jgi:hypothetical protein